jgi:hypothetical protein
MTDIDDRALDSLSVAPAAEEQEGRSPRQDAGQDKSIAKRLQKNPDSVDARLDNGLDETMDGSDPVAISEPEGRGDFVPSSGYDETDKPAAK